MSVGGGFGLRFEKSSGAVLWLPDGAARADARNRAMLCQYAARNAKSWYEFTNGPLGRMVSEQGSLYLVTGHDKTCCWEAAVFSGKARTVSIQFTATASLLGGGKIGMTQASRTQGGVPNRRSRPLNTDNNQTVFIRGFKISLRNRSSTLLYRSAIKVADISGRPSKHTRDQEDKSRSSQNNAATRAEGSDQKYGAGSGGGGGNADDQLSFSNASLGSSSGYGSELRFGGDAGSSVLESQSLSSTASASSSISSVCSSGIENQLVRACEHSQ